MRFFVFLFFVFDKQFIMCGNVMVLVIARHVLQFLEMCLCITANDIKNPNATSIPADGA
jgi:hypothetical protein